MKLIVIVRDDDLMTMRNMFIGRGACWSGRIVARPLCVRWASVVACCTTFLSPDWFSLPFHIELIRIFKHILTKKVLSASGGLCPHTPHQGLCPSTLLGHGPKPPFLPSRFKLPSAAYERAAADAVAMVTGCGVGWARGRRSAWCWWEPRHFVLRRRLLAAKQTGLLSPLVMHIHEVMWPWPRPLLPSWPHTHTS